MMMMMMAITTTTTITTTIIIIIIIIIIRVSWATCPLAESYITAAARETGATAELAAFRKEGKYADVDGLYISEPIAIETLDVFSRSALQLLSDLGSNISQSSGKLERRAFCFRHAQCWCNVSTRFYCTTVCQPGPWLHALMIIPYLFSFCNF